MARRRILVALPVFLFGSAALLGAAESPQSSLSGKLTGSTSRDWLKERESVFMGDGRCHAGERWRFAANGVLKVRRCVNERWVVSRHRWHVADDSGKSVLQIVPALSESGRRVLLSDDGKSLTLRRMPNRKIAGISDIELRLATGDAPDF